MLGKPVFTIRNANHVPVATSNVDLAHEILLVCPLLVGGNAKAQSQSLFFSTSPCVHLAMSETLTWDQTYFGLSSLGAAFVIFAANLGFASCCVRDGRDMYGLSCCDALHS